MATSLVLSQWLWLMVATSGMVKSGNTRVTVCGHQSDIVTMAVVDVATSGMLSQVT